jgi:flagellar hook-associated protein 2
MVAKTAGAEYQQGQDAIFTMKVNGKVMDGVTRMDNTFDVDGLNVTLKGEFGDYTEVAGKDTLTAGSAEAVSFSTKSDSDKIVGDIKDMVKDLNAMLKSIHDGYSTTPNLASDNSRYQPLTEKEKADLTENQIEKYEKDAKAGILFGDRDLSSLYSDLVNAIAPGGAASSALSKIGITTTYSEGITSVTVDETKLRAALDNNPDSVRDAMVSSDGESGFMINVNKAVSKYAGTTGAKKGILVEKAGSSYAPLSLLNNTLQEQMNDLDEDISEWQDKLSSQVDYYNNIFTQLEVLTQQMNSQSNMLASMLGG